MKRAHIYKLNIGKEFGNLCQIIKLFLLFGAMISLLKIYPKEMIQNVKKTVFTKCSSLYVNIGEMH